MNTSLIILNQEAIETLKFSELVTEYNKYATELGIKNIKKFRDKATGQARLAQIVAEYKEELLEIQPEPQPKPKAEEPKKRQTRFNMEAKIETVSDNSKEGTIENSLHAAIASGCETTGEVVTWITTNHKRPRSGQGVDEQYAVHNIKYFVKRGTLKLS